MPTLAYTVLAYTIADLCKATGIGRSEVYLDLKSGKLRAKKHAKERSSRKGERAALVRHPARAIVKLHTSVRSRTSPIL